MENMSGKISWKPQRCQQRPRFFTLARLRGRQSPGPQLMEVSMNGGIPIAGWFKYYGKSHLEVDDWGLPLWLRKPPLIAAVKINFRLKIFAVHHPSGDEQHRKSEHAKKTPETTQISTSSIESIVFLFFFLGICSNTSFLWLWFKNINLKTGWLCDVYLAKMTTLCFRMGAISVCLVILYIIQQKSPLHK